jgi:hypothetical protein
MCIRPLGNVVHCGIQAVQVVYVAGHEERGVAGVLDVILRALYRVHFDKILPRVEKLRDVITWCARRQDAQCLPVQVERRRPLRKLDRGCGVRETLLPHFTVHVTTNGCHFFCAGSCGLPPAHGVGNKVGLLLSALCL